MELPAAVDTGMPASLRRGIVRIGLVTRSDALTALAQLHAQQSGIATFCLA
jgi:hypothetical protein